MKTHKVILHKIGDKSKAVCPFCHALKATTFREKTIPLESGRGKVKDVLVATCDDCDHVVSIPHQSVPRVKEAVEKVRKPVEARIPRQVADVFNLSCFEFGLSAVDSRMALFRYFLKRVAQSKTLSGNLEKLANSEEAKGKRSARFSIRLNESLQQNFESILAAEHLDTTDAVCGIIMQMKLDVLDRPKESIRKEIEELVSLVG